MHVMTVCQQRGDHASGYTYHGCIRRVLRRLWRGVRRRVGLVADDWLAPRQGVWPCTLIDTWVYLCLLLIVLLLMLLALVLMKRLFHRLVSLPFEVRHLANTHALYIFTMACDHICSDSVNIYFL